jgi:RNase H-like domain found in reverse transcriptase
MDKIFHDKKQKQVSHFLDDLKTQHIDWTYHLDAVDELLTRLEVNNFTVNPLKCAWAVQETAYPGYWLTPNGVKPWRKKIQGILNMCKPTAPTQGRSYLGSITFYRDMRNRAHILAPTTALASDKVSFKWTAEHDKAWDTMNAVICEDVLLRFPDFSQPFHLFADASDKQLAVTIKQDDKPIAYYSRKLTPT